MRPYWRGYLKLALVSCPIALHAACSTAERIAFRQINKATGNRLRQQLIDEETREPVDPEHKGRGYEVAKGQYVIVEDEDLEAIEIESTHVIEIDRFVPRQQIDQRFFDTPYYDWSPCARAASSAGARSDVRLTSSMCGTRPSARTACSAAAATRSGAPSHC
jgi:Ku protein